MGTRYGTHTDTPRALEVGVTWPDRIVEAHDLVTQLLLTPHTSRSPWGGMVRRTISGRFLTWPSAWGSGTRTTSPSSPQIGVGGVGLVVAVGLGERLARDHRGGRMGGVCTPLLRSPGCSTVRGGKARTAPLPTDAAEAVDR